VHLAAFVEPDEPDEPDEPVGADGSPGRPPAPTVVGVTRYRFLDGMGDVVAEDEFPDHTAALVWAVDDDGPEEEVQRVEYLGPEGDWRWAGALQS
jgi:hypothetical protein